MIGTEQIQPCATITHQENGVGLLVEATIQPGMKHWTPEQAGEWFAGEWRDALAVLQHKTITAFVATVPDARMVHHDGESWAVVMGNGAHPAEERTIEPPLVEPAPLTESTVAPVAEGWQPGPEWCDRDGVVLAAISQQDKPVSRADIRRETSFSYDQINSSLKRLSNDRQVREVSGKGSGRWKEQVMYTTADKGKRAKS